MKKKYDQKAIIAETLELVLAWQRSTSLSEKEALATKVLQANESFINWCVSRRLKGFGLKRMNDLFKEAKQAASIGVLYALRKFDPDKIKTSKNGFINYAGFWIRKELNDFINLQMRGDVYVPIGRRMQARKERASLANPERNNLSEKTLACFPVMGDFYYNADDGEDYSTETYLVSHQSKLNFEKWRKELDVSFQKRFLKKLLTCLSKRELYIIEERAKEKTLEQVGNGLGITRERVRQLEARAIAKMRQASDNFADKANLFTKEVADANQNFVSY